VRTVIALTTEVPPPAWVRTAPDVHWLPVPDYHSPTVAQFREACTVLDTAVSAKRAAFIYCGAGKGRAPTVYAAWLIWRGAAVAEALARLRKVRRVAKHTAEQLATLAEWSSLCKNRAEGSGKREG
jgi:protein-tyrosine phosphatase